MDMLPDGNSRMNWIDRIKTVLRMFALHANIC